ncbi:zinc fingers and homeoboxes protein 3 [Latimeria chalumnae]|uniref:Zinc fingers and homeoboxes 3 n=1 Tax=Latimeria chalumnae TaxID=7897 RepID=H3BIC2_LATCH|nr:PREDICTED: zinc fingers and homeoboxes protein 3 [Latimeria chalumnae]XP_005986805.1 PREDICTED: zinc fingers and homeoboxes protein 3 [Latimeria chalumnae]|eukprot:XP_005986804.1 PREDICTED: zinc fingers and homeoboxes protein 3 [Latimeria chalumnae]
MASKRKSTTPCMIPIKRAPSERADVEALQDYKEDNQQGISPASLLTSEVRSDEDDQLTNGHQNPHNGDSYVCKYCDFATQDLNKFMVHLDTDHPDFSMDPIFVCLECAFLAKNYNGLALHNAERHSGETSFLWNVVKQNSQTLVEQSFSGAASCKENSAEGIEDQCGSPAEISITKTPIIKMLKSKPEPKRIAVPHTQKENLSVASGNGKPVTDRNGTTENNCAVNGLNTVAPSSSGSTSSSQLVNGSLVGSMPVLQSTGLTQLMSVLQQPTHSSKSLPKVMIPLSSIPTYNAAMDTNCFLKNSLSKFPYPTKAELCWLTVVTKYPEEQIKIWFTAQRLKQGISWSPEEIEDSRKKMFNTVIQSVPPQTITLLNAPTATTAFGAQHLIHGGLSCQLVGQSAVPGGVIVSQPFVANGVPIKNTPISLPTGHTPKLPTPMQTNMLVSESASASGLKVVNTAPSVLSACPSISSQNLFVESGMYKNKKSQEQLSALKESFFKNQFPSPEEVERLMKITGLSTREVRKWFSDRRYHYRNLKASKYVLGAESSSSNSTTVILDSQAEESPAPIQHVPRRHPWNQTPSFTPTRYKERAPEQLKALEKSFSQGPFPSEDEVDRLRSETKMTRREIDTWFIERRKKAAEENWIKNETAVKQEEDVQDEDEGEEEEDLDDMKTPSECGSVEMPSGSQPTTQLKVSPIKINLKNLKVTDANGRLGLQALQVSSHGSDSSSRASTPQKSRGQNKKTVGQLHLLKKLFVRTQWPSNEEYDMLATESGLPRNEVVRWFGDNRYAFKNGQLKWFEDYRKGVYPVELEYANKKGKDILEQYFSKNKVLYEVDLSSLCERSRMTAKEIQNWFAERTAEEAGNASDDGSEDHQSSNGDPTGSQKGEGACDAGSEASDTSENWETGPQEGNGHTLEQYPRSSEITLEIE